MFEGDDDEEGFELVELTEPKPTSAVAKVLCVGVSIIVILLLVAVIYIFAKYPFVERCKFSDSDVITPRDVNNPGVFDDLTLSEYYRVRDFLMSNSEFNLTAFDHASVSSNYVYMVELQVPEKGFVLSYLDGNVEKPPRVAKVTIVFGNNTKPPVLQYLVSLPDNNGLNMTIKPIPGPDTRTIPLPSIDKPLDKVITKYLFSQIIDNITETLYQVLMQRFNLCYHNCTTGENCLRIELFQDNKDDGYSGQFVWARFLSSDALPYTFPLGLDILIDYTSPVPEQWSIKQILLDNKGFTDIDSLLEQQNSQKGQEHVTTYNRDFHPGPDTSPRHGPRLIDPEGKRYTIHGQRVTYSKWNFDFNMSPSYGLRLFNVKFHGEMILYEISLQQILTPHTRFVSPRLFGESAYELVRGMDCPDTAVYLDSTVFINSERPKTTQNNICIFETSGNSPYRRHYQRNSDGGSGVYFGTDDYYLVVRTIATVGLFDYILDYMLRDSGEVVVKVSTTGSEDIRFVMDNINAFAEQVWRAESLNTHVFAFKADIDINGTSNRFSHVAYDRQPTSVLGRTPQAKLTTTAISSENLNKKVGPGNFQSFYVYNNGATNTNGQTRAYKIINNSPVDGYSTYANGQVFSTLHKDTEANIDFHLRKKGQHQILPYMLSDNEGLLDVDLLTWVIVGSSHVTSMEDIPSSPAVQNTCSFSIAPHNYMAQSATIQSADSIWIRPSVDDEDNLMIETFGRNLETTCFHKTVGPFEYSGNKNKVS